MIKIQYLLYLCCSCWMSSTSKCWRMQSKSIVASNDTGTLSENECPSSLPFLAFLLYQECIVPLYGVTRTRTSNPLCLVFFDGRAFPCLDPGIFSRYRRLSNGRLYCIWIVQELYVTVTGLWVLHERRKMERAKKDRVLLVSPLMS